MLQRKLLIQYLASTKEEVIATVASLDPSRHAATPPPALGDWSPQRILAHMWDVEAHYARWEREMAAGERRTIPPIVWSDEPWDPKEPVADILARLVRAREDHIALLESLDDLGWSGRATRPEWNEITVEWLATKAYQHTLDHLNQLVRMDIFWEIRARQDAQRPGAPPERA